MYTRDVLAGLAEKIARHTSCATREKGRERERGQTEKERERAARGERESAARRGSEQRPARFQREITLGARTPARKRGGNTSVAPRWKRRRRLRSFDVFRALRTAGRGSINNLSISYGVYRDRQTDRQNAVSGILAPHLAPKVVVRDCVAAITKYDDRGLTSMTVRD